MSPGVRQNTSELIMSQGTQTRCTLSPGDGAHLCLPGLHPPVRARVRGQGDVPGTCVRAKHTVTNKKDQVPVLERTYIPAL